MLLDLSMMDANKPCCIEFRGEIIIEGCSVPGKQNLPVILMQRDRWQGSRRGYHGINFRWTCIVKAAAPYHHLQFCELNQPLIGLIGWCDADEQDGGDDHLPKYRHEWNDHQFIICVFNNEDRYQVAWKQQVLECAPKV